MKCHKEKFSGQGGTAIRGWEQAESRGEGKLEGGKGKCKRRTKEKRAWGAVADLAANLPGLGCSCICREPGIKGTTMVNIVGMNTFKRQMLQLFTLRKLRFM